MQNFKQYIKDNFIDEQFARNKLKYIRQCLVIFACIAIVLLLYEMLGAIVIASLGASCFIVFMLPHADSSRLKFVLGGYVCGSVVGVACGLLYGYVSGLAFEGSTGVLVLIGAAAVAVASFLMVVTNSEHPPAAALTLGLVMSSGRLLTAPVAILSVLIFCGIRHVLRKHLINLL